MPRPASEFCGTGIFGGNGCGNAILAEAGNLSISQMPQVAKARSRNKYGYVYPEGEGYVSMEKRIHRGLQKVFYLNNYSENIMIVGHRAVNRMILSDFVFRQKEEVPYIYMPQNRYYHLQIDPHKKNFELKPY